MFLGGLYHRGLHEPLACDGLVGIQSLHVLRPLGGILDGLRLKGDRLPGEPLANAERGQARVGFGISWGEAKRGAEGLRGLDVLLPKRKQHPLIVP